MKIAVLSYSGNCGKTTVAGQLLKPRLKNAEIYSIESFNSGLENDGVEAEKIQANQYMDIINNVMIAENVIIDVGASNVGTFLKLMSQYKSSHAEFDYFVIPVTKEKKQQIDTINVIETLSSLGIPAKKILVIFNKVDVDELEQVEQDFRTLLALQKMDKSFKVFPECPIHANDIYDAQKELGLSVDAILNDTTDYRAKIKETQDRDKKLEFASMIAYKNLSMTAKENMDGVYKAVFG